MISAMLLVFIRSSLDRVNDCLSRYSNELNDLCYALKLGVIINFNHCHQSA